MRYLRFLVAILLPMVVCGYNTQMVKFNIDAMTLVYRRIYMYAADDSPRKKSNYKSEVSLDISITPQNLTSSLYGVVETAVTTEEVFQKIGYLDSRGNRIACCDEEAYRRDKCKNVNSLLIPPGYEDQYKLEQTVLSGSEASIKMTFEPKKTGIYYVLTAVCDYHLSPFEMEGTMVVENPYGKLPAPQYGSLPFFSFMCIGYVIALIIWSMLCISYSKEVMSVQVIILIVLISFVIDYIIKVLYLEIYNRTGNNPYIFSFVSIAVDCTTRTLTRILTLVVCMGLGVCKATLGNSLCQFIVFGVVYYIISFWDAYCALYPVENTTLEFVRLFVTSAIDAMVYFWIFQSLMDTMDELTEKKQEAKLAIFTKLRNLLVVSVVVATTTLIVFSYIIISDYSRNIWKYQWFINDGIWSIYYFLLFFFIMVMWKPSENSSEYAYHIQVATNADDNEGEYLPTDKLIDSEDEGTVVVNTVNSEMKPMNMSETVTQA